MGFSSKKLTIVGVGGFVILFRKNVTLRTKTKPLSSTLHIHSAKVQPNGDKKKVATNTSAQAFPMNDYYLCFRPFSGPCGAHLTPLLILKV